jgi:hypothetical protein
VPTPRPKRLAVPGAQRVCSQRASAPPAPMSPVARLPGAHTHNFMIVPAISRQKVSGICGTYLIAEARLCSARACGRRRSEPSCTAAWLSNVFREGAMKSGDVRARGHFRSMARQKYLKVVCAWCTRTIGWKRKEGAVPDDLSHGICPACAAVLLRKMHARQQSADSGVA